MTNNDQPAKAANRYEQIIEEIFFTHYVDASREVPFEREDIGRAAEKLGIKLPKNIGDMIYSFRYRTDLPQSIRQRSPAGEEWIILPVGRSRYAFVATALARILPNKMLAETKIPDATPGIITKYALSDEQALLAKLRYNRMIDIFTGVTCYSLQNHLRSTVPDVGQVETDEIYVGLDRRGAHFVFPVQAKGGKDILSVVQIVQDLLLCQTKFPTLICRPIAAQFMDDTVIALFEFEKSGTSIAISSERHYRLVTPEDVTETDIQQYRIRPPD